MYAVHRRPIGLLVACFALTLLVSSGCGEPGASEDLTTPQPQKALGPIELTPIKVANFESVINDYKGQVVLVDVWFLGCSPCVKKFPQFVELHRKYADQGLVCISMDILAEEMDRKDEVLAFLEKQGADFPNLIFDDEYETIEAWQERYNAQLTPAMILFDRNGERVEMPRSPAPKDLQAAIQKALAK